MGSLVSEIAFRFWQHPDLVIETEKTGEVSLLHSPIGRQLFHSRPYGALFDLDQPDEDMVASGPKMKTDFTADLTR